MLALHGYTADQMQTLKGRLEKVVNQSQPLVTLTPADGVCGLDMVDIAYRLESPLAHAIYATKAWYNPVTFDVDRLTVRQILSVWDALVRIPEYNV